MSELKLMFQCPSCGSNEGIENNNYVKCKCCGNKYRRDLKEEPVYADLSYAVNERQEADFDKARRRYDALISKYKTGPGMEEAHWGRFLCEQYVIFYQNDAGNSIPSFWNINEEPCTRSESYKKAIQYGEKSGNRDNYERMAEQIEEYKNKYRKVKKEFPEGSQIFICFKDSGTDDSNVGYQIYHSFAGRYNVFFSRESLNNIRGNDYEPYIYHALTTAKVLIVLCSSRESLESKWVHNEWWRFWKFSKGTDKTIIPVCRRGFSPSQLPDELRNCQAHNEDISLISVLTNRIDSILKNDEMSGAPLTSFGKKLNIIDATFEAGNIDDAKIQLRSLIEESVSRPHDHVSALLMQSKILSDNYRYLKNANAAASVAKAEELAKSNDIQIKDMPEYRRYRAAVSRGRTKKALIAVLASVLVAGGSIAAVVALQDPMADIYVTGRPAVIEVEYGSDYLSAISSITTVSQKGKEKVVDINSSMVSGFDPVKLGMQTVNITYNGITIPVNINMVKYSLASPAGLTVSGGKITWEKVPQAKSYTLQVNGTEISGIIATSYEGDAFNASGIYNVKVKAVADNTVGNDSLYSAAISVINLKEASGISANGSVLSWDAVDGCTQYDVYCGGVKIGSAVTNSYTVPAERISAGANLFYVLPVGAHNMKLSENASNDELNDFEHNGELTLYKFNQASGLACNKDGTLSWTPVDGATSYDIYINGAKAGNTEEASFIPEASKVSAGANTVYVIPVGACNLSSSAEPGTDFAHNGEITIYKLKQASDLKYGADGKLTWAALSGDITYEVYANGVLLTSTKENTYTPEAGRLAAGANLFYVIPVNGFNLSSDSNANFEHNGELTLYCYNQATGLSYNNANGTVSWNAIPSCNSYAVYVNGKLAETVSGTSCAVPAGKIRAGANKISVACGGGGNLSANEGTDYEHNGEITLYCYKQAAGLAYNHASGTISWTAVPSCNGYDIYVNGELAETVSGTSCAIPVSKMKAGDNVIYVIPKNGCNLSASAGTDYEHNGEIIVKKLGNVTGIAVNGMTMSWNTVDGALSYEVLLNGEVIATVSQPSFTLSSGGNTANSVYTVRAIGGEGIVSSDISLEEITFKTLSAPVNITINSDGDLSWSAVSGAFGYDIYAGSTLLKTVDADTLSFSLVGELEKGTYNISVVAKGNGGNVMSSANSAAVSHVVNETIIYIDSEEDLKNIALDLGASYVLKNDITLTGAWTPIGTTSKPFTGLFDGKGHKIIGLSITESYAGGTGLFGVIDESGTVKNIILEGVSIDGADNSRVGALAGVNYGSVSGISVYGTIDITNGNYVGGIIGINYGSVYECTNNASITGEKYVGGIAGSTSISDYSAMIHSCTNNGAISGNYRVGGIMGVIGFERKNTVYGMVNNGNVTASDEDAGGIFGYVSGSSGQRGTLQSCANNGNVIASDYAGGCFGHIGTYITVITDNISEPALNCTNSGTVTAIDGSKFGEIYPK